MPFAPHHLHRTRATISLISNSILGSKILIGSLKNPSIATNLYASGLYASAPFSVLVRDNPFMID